MDITPRSSTAPERDPRSSAQGSSEKQNRVTYEHYLRTPLWFARRNQALREAKYRCHRCASPRNLQVHHLSYDRLGAELDTDLEVLCKGCHLGHHSEQAREKITLYIKLAREVLYEQPEAGLAELTEYLKRKCARLHIGYDSRIVCLALQTIKAGIKTPPVAKHVQEWLETAQDWAPTGRVEAAAVISRLGLASVMKHVPEVKPIRQRTADRMRAAKLIAQAIQHSIEECERLEREAEDAK